MPPTDTPARGWRQYLPPAERRFEIGILGVAGVAIAWMTYQISVIDSQLRDQQVRIQLGIEQLMEAQSQAGVGSTLLPRLTCSEKAETIRSALQLIQRSAPDYIVIAAFALSQCNSLLSSQPDLKDFVEHLDQLDIEQMFIKQVDLGDQYYESKLFDLAAKTWYHAMNLIPDSYYPPNGNGLIGEGDMDNVVRARDEYENRKYETSARRYYKAFRKVHAK